MSDRHTQLESTNLVTKTLAGDDGNLINSPLVGMEVGSRETRVVTLDDHYKWSISPLNEKQTLSFFGQHIVPTLTARSTLRRLGTNTTHIV